MREPNTVPGQPFTLRGVARHAFAPFLRILGTSLLFALPAGLAAGWLAAHCWAPVIQRAVTELPRTGRIQRGALAWPEPSGRLLAANPFLSLAVRLENEARASASVDCAIEFERHRVEIRSLLGSVFLPYPKSWTIEFNRDAIAPLWGAWRVPLIAGIMTGSAILLVAAWFGLASLYLIAPLFLGKLLGRQAGLASAWKLSVAAQWAGSLLMSFALILYGITEIGLLLLLIVFVAHFVPTLAYLLGAPFHLPRVAADRSANPFQEEKKRLKGGNPFSGSEN